LAAAIEFEIAQRDADIVGTCQRLA